MRCTYCELEATHQVSRYSMCDVRKSPICVLHAVIEQERADKWEVSVFTGPPPKIEELDDAPMVIRHTDPEHYRND